MKIIKAIIDRLRAARDAIFSNWIIAALAIPGLIVGTYFAIFLVSFLVPEFAHLFRHDGFSKTDKYATSPLSDDVLYLKQGWGERFRQGYYFTPQGSQIIPLDMALALEGPDSQTLFFGDNGLAVTQFGYIPYAPTRKSNDNVFYENRFGLPVGFTIDGFIEKRYRNSGKDETMMLGINCAACHTSNMTIAGQTVRIEGNQGMGDFMGLFTAMDIALEETRKDSAKFTRFLERQQALLAQDADMRKGPQRMVDGLDKLIEQTRETIEREEKEKRWKEAKAKNLKPSDLPLPIDTTIMTMAKKRVMEMRMDAVLARRKQWQDRNTPDVEGGYGRVDAFGVIFNQVTGRDIHMDHKMIVRGENAAQETDEMVDIGNTVTPNAPVSYPVLWDTPHMGRVQWNASANNVSRGGVLGRNLGQVLGVFGKTEVTRQKIGLGYCSTVKKTNLLAMDYWVRSLNSPLWRDEALEGLLPPIDQAKADIGAGIYQTECQDCHALPPEKFREETPKDKKECDMTIRVMDANKVGTDPATALTGVRTGAQTNMLGGLDSRARDDLIMAPQEPHANILREVVARSILGTYQTVTCDGQFGPRAMASTAAGIGELVRAQVGQHVGLESRISGGFDLYPSEAGEDDKRDKSQECPADKTVYDFPDAQQKDVYHPFAYRSRPLNGIWASAPYLHNGSVPTLADLLAPEAERPATFHVGNVEFDPVKVGFKTDPAEGTFLFDTRPLGNKNIGHLYGTNLEAEQKAALLEYLKTL